MTKPKERSPAMQFYFRQFAGDERVMSMDLDAVGAHILLMCAAGASEHGYKLAYDERALRVRLRNPSDPDFSRIMSQLLAGSWKVSDDGKWIVQDGQRRTLLKQKEFSKKQKANAQRRWGSQEDANGMPNGMPNGCSSSSSSSTSTSKDLNTYSLPLEAPESLQSALQAWSKLQKQKFKREVSQVEVDALMMSWAPRFAELEAAIIYSTANGWKNIREKTPEGSGTNGTHQAVYPKRQTAQEAKAERLKALHAKMSALDEQDRIAGKQVKITMGDIFK